MDSYREVLSSELVWNIIPSIIVLLILIAVFCVLPRFLQFLEMTKWKRILSAVIAALFLLNVCWSYMNLSPIIFDLKKNTFITYTGEVDYLSNKSSKETDVFQLNESPGVCVEIASGKIDATIQTCIARVVYSKHSKLIVEIEVYEIIETRLPINIY